MTAARRIIDDAAGGFSPLTAPGSGVVYGPFDGLAEGRAIGINPLGTGAKICSFNCVYCDLGKTEVRLNKIKGGADFPPLADIEREITEAFKKIHASGPTPDAIVVAGNGEPTLHPDFHELARFLVSTRDLWLPGKPISVYTNGAGLDTRKIADAVNLFDQRVVKIDAGSDRLFKAVNAPLSRTNIARVLNGIRNLKDVIVQSLFFDGEPSNTQPSDIDEWLEVVAMIRPKAVHIHGMTRAPATPGLVRCEQDTLYAIASRLERKTQIKAIVIP